MNFVFFMMSYHVDIHYQYFVDVMLTILLFHSFVISFVYPFWSDYFMVFLQKDPSETRYTKYKPVIPLYERYKTLMSLKYIDEVVTYQTEDDLIKLIEFYKPDIRILGDDYIGKRFTGDHLPIKVIYTTRSHDWSTTKIKDLITIQTIKQNPEIINRAND